MVASKESIPLTKSQRVCLLNRRVGARPLYPAESPNFQTIRLTCSQQSPFGAIDLHGYGYLSPVVPLSEQRFGLALTSPVSRGFENRLEHSIRLCPGNSSLEQTLCLDGVPTGLTLRFTTHAWVIRRLQHLRAGGIH